MTKKNSPQKARGLSLPFLALGAVAVISSFTVGLRTSADVQTIAPMQASDIRMTGDVTGDGILDTYDAIAILEVARGYRDPTADELLGDPNADGQLTIDDAIRILHDLSIR